MTVPRGVGTQDLRQNDADTQGFRYAKSRGLVTRVAWRMHLSRLMGAPHQPACAESSSADLTTAPDLIRLARNAEDARRLRQRSMFNLWTMGHCAPTVMQTALDLAGVQSSWLVRLSAGLPGGIGNMGFECGGITAPMLLLGLQNDTNRPGQRQLPSAFTKAHEFVHKFAADHHSPLCREIRRGARLPLVCIGVIQRSTQLLATMANEPGASTLSPERAECYRALLTHLERTQFHCAHEVFAEIAAPCRPDPWLCRAASLFVGGLAFAGFTCSALTAGVLALGSELATIETSRARVLRMIGLMAVGGDAFADDVNEFNKTMNRGQRLARWFEAEFGSTQCRAITRCDFGVPTDVGRFIDQGGFERCRAMARRVGAQVRGMIAETADVARAESETTRRG